MQLVKLVMFTFCTHAAYAEKMDTLMPIEPAHTVAQSRVNSLMLLEELHQFKSIADWHRNKHLLEISKAKLSRAKSEFERAQKLRKERVITEKALANSFSIYEALLIDVTRLEYEILLAKGMAELHRLRVLEEGNPQIDYRKDIASMLAHGLKVEVESLKKRLEIAKAIQDIAKSQYETGKGLHARNAMSTADLEKRELTYKEAVHTVESVSAIVKISQIAAEAFEDNHRRL